MNRITNRRRASSHAIGAAVAVASLGPTAFAAAAALPTVTYDLRVNGGGGKTADVTHAGQAVVLDLYAHVQGLDLNPNNDAISLGGGTFTSSSGGLLGDLFGLGPPSPFNASGAQSGSQVDYDSDGDLDIWSPTTGAVGYYIFRHPPPAPMPQPDGGWLVGQVQFTVTAFNLDQTDVAWTQRASATSLVGIADGASVNRNGVNVAYGTPVTIRGVEPTPPPGVVYLSGNIAAHTSITQPTWVAPGQSLTFATGVDIAAGGALNAAGRPLTINVNDATSGNFGGEITGGNVSVATTADGTFTQSSGATGVGNVTVGASAGRAGTLNVVNGTLQAISLALGGAGGGTGTYAQSGGDAKLVNLAIRNGSAATVTGGTLEAVGVSTIGDGGNGTFTQNGGATRLNGDVFVGAGSGGVGSIVVQNGTLTAGRTVVGLDAAQGSVQVSGGAFKPSVLILHGNGAGTTTVAVTGGQLHTGTIQFSNAAVVAQSGGAVSLPTGTGSIWLANNAGEYQYALSAGTLDIGHLRVSKTNDSPVAASGHRGGFAQTGGTVNAHSMQIDATGTYDARGGAINIASKLDLRGTLDYGGSSARLNVGPSAFASFVSGQLLNAGNATFTGADGSLMSFKDQAQYDGVGTVTSSGLVHIAGQPLVIPQNQSIGGSGTIEGDVTNNGTIAPGSSPGAIAVNGSFRQASTGALLMEIGGTEAETFDTLSITGGASIDGLLNLALLEGFVPSAADTFTILTAGSLSGTFDNVIAGEIEFPAGRFDVAYTPTAVTLSNFQPVPEPGGVMLLTLAVGAASMRRRRSFGRSAVS